jgi:hypothetical protein
MKEKSKGQELLAEIQEEEKQVYSHDFVLEESFSLEQLENVYSLLKNRIYTYYPELSMAKWERYMLLYFRDSLLKSFLADGESDFTDFILVQINLRFPIEDSVAMQVLNEIEEQNTEVYELIKTKTHFYYDYFTVLLKDKGHLMRSDQNQLKREVKLLIKELREKIVQKNDSRQDDIADMVQAL